MNPGIWAVDYALDAVRRLDEAAERSWQDVLWSRLSGLMLSNVIIKEVAVTRDNNKNLPPLSPTQAQIDAPIVVCLRIRSVSMKRSRDSIVSSGIRVNSIHTPEGNRSERL
jgi:hypothetical protein